jgi:hypothetical protein
MRFLLVLASSPRDVFLEHQGQVGCEGWAVRIQREDATPVAIGPKQLLLQDAASSALRAQSLEGGLCGPMWHGALFTGLLSRLAGDDAWHVPLLTKRNIALFNHDS